MTPPGDPEVSARALEALGSELSREISQKIDRTLAENQIRDGYIRLLVTR